MDGMIRKDINTKGLNEDILLSMNEWSRIIYVIDPVYSLLAYVAFSK